MEIGFDALEKAPMTTMETIYNKLGLTGLDAARPDMEAYLDSVRKYQRNTYRPLPGPRLERIRSEWDFWFKEFGYSQ